MFDDNYKCCCNEGYYHEEHCDHCCEKSYLRRKCCKCGSYCNIVSFKKYNGCCKYIYKCQCGYCFEIICDNNCNCSYERECCCLEEKETISLNVYCKEKSCKNKKSCSHSCSKNKYFR